MFVMPHKMVYSIFIYKYLIEQIHLNLTMQTKLLFLLLLFS